MPKSLGASLSFSPKLTGWNKDLERREIITVRGQSYVSRLILYLNSPLLNCTVQQLDPMFMLPV
jgi:hypothetical protein